MNTLLFGLICCVVVLSAYADEDVKAAAADKKESDIKVYKRLIPADVLRGECFNTKIYLQFFNVDFYRFWGFTRNFSYSGQNHCPVIVLKNKKLK